MNEFVYIILSVINNSCWQLGNHGSNLTEEELETHTISAWKEGRVQLNRPGEGHARAFQWRLIHVSGSCGFNLHIFALALACKL